VAGRPTDWAGSGDGGGERVFLAGDRDGIERAGVGSEGAGKPAAFLVLSMPSVRLSGRPA